MVKITLYRIEFPFDFLKGLNFLHKHVDIFYIKNRHCSIQCWRLQAVEALLEYVSRFFVFNVKSNILLRIQISTLCKVKIVYYEIVLKLHFWGFRETDWFLLCIILSWVILCLQDKKLCSLYIYIFIYCAVFFLKCSLRAFILYHHHHHVVLVVRISLTLSRHFSLSFIASGRSSWLHPVSSHSCWMHVRAGHPAFVRPYVGVYKSTSLMSSSLLLQQCFACLVCLTWLVFVMGGRWLYSWCLVGWCRQDLFKIARSILV